MNDPAASPLLMLMGNSSEKKKKKTVMDRAHDFVLDRVLRFNSPMFPVLMPVRLCGMHALSQ